MDEEDFHYAQALKLLAAISEATYALQHALTRACEHPLLGTCVKPAQHAHAQDCISEVVGDLFYDARMDALRIKEAYERRDTSRRARELSTF